MALIGNHPNTAWEHSSEQSKYGVPPRMLPVLVGGWACLTAVALHIGPIFHPILFDDDFAIVRDSWTWSDTVVNLWRPWNEHAMPLGRLTTFGLVRIAGAVTNLPVVTSLQGPVSVIIGMWLVYLFLTRELGHRFYGLVGMTFFGVSLKYNEAVFWFAASFAILALDTALVALICAQWWRDSRRPVCLAACVLACALAPGWFALGVLAGPLCSVYLFARGRVLWLAPLLGTALFLTVSLFHNAEAILNAEHFDGRSASQVFNPAAGITITCRTIVDNLVLGIRTFGTHCPPALIPPLMAALGAITAVWLWNGRKGGVSLSLIRLSVSLVFLPFLLVYSFRADWPYETLMIRWTRYNLFPFVGLVFVVCAGLPSRDGSLFRLASASLSGRQALALVVLAIVLFTLQFPAVWSERHNRSAAHVKQMAVLDYIADVDRRCIARGVSTPHARTVLPPLDIPFSGDPTPRISGWDLLRGDKMDRGVTAVDTRSLLQP